MIHGQVPPLGDAEFMAIALEHQSQGVAVIGLPDLVYEYVNPAFQAFAPGKSMTGCRNSEVFPEMDFLAPRVIGSLKRVGDSWRAENLRNHIRRSFDAPLEEVYGTFDITLVEIHGKPHLLVTAVETTEAVAVERDNQRMHDEESRRLHFSDTLDQVNAVIHSSLDYDEVMQHSLEEATKALGAKAGAVFVGLGGESEARYVFGFPRALLGRRFSADAFPLSRLMEERKTPITVGAEDMGTLMNTVLAKLFRVRSLLAIPLVVRGTLAGGIGLVYRAPHEFTRAEVDFATALGVSVSLALENAELYRHQEQLADTLQDALLTLPAEIPGLTFAHAYNSASEATRVGGDFYDLFELEHDRVGITIGDISGKGIEAAVLTSLVKNAIRTKATESQSPPSVAMSLADKVLHEGSGPESFATVFFGVLDCPTGVLTFCSGGHPPAVLIRAGGGLERLPANSPALGALEEASFTDTETRLDRGDLLFAYTDGLIEARSGAEFFGEERLIGSIGKSKTSNPENLVSAVMDAVLEFTGGELSDDVAVLALARTTKDNGREADR